MTQATLSHIDTCLSCYLMDHHNRPGELLLGVAVDNETTYSGLMDGVRQEFAMIGDCVSEDEVSPAEFELALADAFAEIKDLGSLFDASLEPLDESGEACCAWFLLKWNAQNKE